MSLDRMLQEADRNVADGIVDEADFDDERGRSAAELFEELMLRSRPEEDLVFTHGDYCLPNVIIDGEEVSGFVDWGRAGVADRYKDIALIVRSLEYNTGRDLRAMFFEAYGLPSPDADKIEYYKLLDEFFWQVKTEATQAFSCQHQLTSTCRRCPARQRRRNPRDA